MTLSLAGNERLKWFMRLLIWLQNHSDGDTVVLSMIPPPPSPGISVPASTSWETVQFLDQSSKTTLWCYLELDGAISNRGSHADWSLSSAYQRLTKASQGFHLTTVTYSPQWGAADTEIEVPSDENTELKCSPFKAWSRTVYSHTCYTYCQGFRPCLFLPFLSIHLHFFQNLSGFFPVLAV